MEVIIGLEIHIQLKTASKMFCSCPVAPGAGKPNTQVCPVCMGHPGTLPVVNREAMRLAMRLALALNCRIAAVTRFDRKNYFYPDLPKGYQISQFATPLAENGFLELDIDGSARRFGILRLHVEEDAGKNIHREGQTLVDFNRAGTPLAEIVTRADFRRPIEAKVFLQELRLIARYLGASNADMEKGQLRCDANISLRPIGDTRLHPKTELKNMNSFKSVERALEYEVVRQGALWKARTPPQRSETRGWSDDTGVTHAQRDKEESDDYRYFPEPDLLPISIAQEDVDAVVSDLPELPQAKRARFVSEYALSYSEAAVLAARPDLADYFESVVSELALQETDIPGAADQWKADRTRLIKYAHSWIVTELLRHLNADGGAPVRRAKITPENMAEFVLMLSQGVINSSAAQQILDVMYQTGRDPHHIAEEEALYQVSDEGEISGLVKQVIADNPKQVEQYKAGKDGVLQFFIGKVMAASKGKANPEIVSQTLQRELSP